MPQTLSRAQRATATAARAPQPSSARRRRRHELARCSDRDQLELVQAACGGRRPRSLVLHWHTTPAARRAVHRALAARRRSRRAASPSSASERLCSRLVAPAAPGRPPSAVASRRRLEARSASLCMGALPFAARAGRPAGAADRPISMVWRVHIAWNGFSTAAAGAPAPGARAVGQPRYVPPWGILDEMSRLTPALREARAAMNVLHTIWEGLSNALLMAWTVWWALVFGFAISAVVQAWVPRERIERALGGQRRAAGRRWRRRWAPPPRRAPTRPSRSPSRCSPRALRRRARSPSSSPRPISSSSSAPSSGSCSAGSSRWPSSSAACC